MRIGIYGGTFNPPHLGHLTAAECVFRTLKLDKLLLIPAGIPPHKALPQGSPTAEQRLEMTLNRPFLYGVRSADTLLFIGVCENPAQQAE